MAEAFAALIPVFSIIVLGLILRRSGIPSTGFWNQNDRLVYWVLLPCLMFEKMSTAVFPTSLLFELGGVLMAGFMSGVVFGL